MNLIAMAHPDGRFLGQAVNERIVLLDRQLGPSKFACLGGFDLSAEDLHASCMP